MNFLSPAFAKLISGGSTVTPASKSHRGIITARMSGPDEGGWSRIQIGNVDQPINLVSRPRHFGGWL
jgi:hypothetical protein